MNLGLVLGLGARRTVGIEIPAVPSDFISAIATDGWQATAVSPTDPPALDVIDVTRAGFDTSGSTTTIADTVLLTKRVRQAYPNEGSFTTDQVALSDYIYASDTIAGVANNSTQVSPKPIATWAMHDREVVGNSLPWEIVTFHRDARLGRQCACVGVRATDGTNTTAWQYVSATTLSSLYEDAFAPEVYAGTLDITGLNDDSLITLEGKVFPWFGTSASVLDSTTETEWRFGPRYFYKNIARSTAPNLVYVESTGNDSTGVVSTDPATAAATPCLTVAGAVARAVAALGTSNKNALSGLEIRIVDGVNSGAFGFIFVNMDAAAIKVTRAPGTTRASANLTIDQDVQPVRAGNNGSPDLSERSMIFEDMTITMGGARLFRGATTQKLHLQFVNMTLDFGAFSHTTGLKSNSHTSYFGVEALGNNSMGETSAGDNRTIRGVTDLDYGGFAVQGLNTFGCLLGNARISNSASQRGTLIYNNHLPNPPTNNAAVIVQGATAGSDIFAAVVQNLIPRLTVASADVSLRLSGDKDNGNFIHAVVHHNTCPGDAGAGRWNVFYDDTEATARTHKFVSFVGNLGPQLNVKGDVFMTNGTRLGHFPFHHGVGCDGVFTEDLDSGGGGINFGQAYGGINSDIAGGDPLYTNDKAASGGSPGTTGGVYTLNGSSPARDLTPRRVLAFDIAGSARPTSGTVDAGAYA